MSNVNKQRQPVLAAGGVQSGNSGTLVSQMLAGTVSACFLAMATGASAAGSAAVSGVAAGDLIWVTGACTSGSAFITSASVTADNKVEFRTYNSSSGTSGASTVTLQYIAVRTGTIA
jgi:hypothetical protein